MDPFREYTSEIFLLVEHLKFGQIAIGGVKNQDLQREDIQI